MIDVAGGKAGLQIKFVSTHDPLNVRAFSGTIFYMAKALQKVFPDIELVRDARPSWFERLETLVRRATRDRKNPRFWRWLNRHLARRLARRWRGERAMVISAVAAPLAGELAALVPVINISDATFELMRSFYPAFARIDNDVAAAAEEAERRCILGAVHNSFSSAWAARSAVLHYGAPEASVSVISWGCNIPDVPPHEMRSADPSRQVCRLLFLGADWVRKGGDVAAATAEILASRGFALQLDLVGSTPLEGVPDAPWIQMHGFLSKADPEQKARLEMLVRNADFLFLPTRQDCTPMVFAEANAYGTPAITRDVGGVADVVRHGRNGFVLPDDAGPADFADCIERTWGERAGYAKLRETARREYEERLNWWSWARAIAEIVHAERLPECPNSTQQL